MLVAAGAAAAVGTASAGAVVARAVGVRVAIMEL